MISNLKFWISIVLAFGFHHGFSQVEIEWASKSKSHNYYIRAKEIPAKGGWFAIEGSYEAYNLREVTVYDPENFGKTKTYNLTSGKKKDKDFFWTGSTSIGGYLYKYDVEYSEAVQKSSVVLECINADKPDIVINEIANPKGKDIVVNHSAISPNHKYSVVYTSSVLGKTFRDRMIKVPYIGIPFAYFIKRDPIFYERTNVFTVFDENGNKAWTKTFTMGEGDTA